MRMRDRVFGILVGVLVACGGGKAPPPTTGATSAPPVASASAGSAGVSQDEIAWALELETKVKNGYQPTAEETARYQDIAERLSKTQAAPPASVPQTPAERLSKTQAAPPASAPQTPSVTEEEIEWAVLLEQRVTGQRYQPTAKEAARYEDITRRLIEAQHR